MKHVKTPNLSYESWVSHLSVGNKFKQESKLKLEEIKMKNEL